jgi:transcriptional regulator with XRE-family HTH domain
MIPIGKAIREARQKNGLSSLQLGERMGNRRQVVWKVETGFNNPGLEIIERFAKALGTSASDLVRRAEEMEEESRKRRIRLISEAA